MLSPELSAVIVQTPLVRIVNAPVLEFTVQTDVVVEANVVEPIPLGFVVAETECVPADSPSATPLGTVKVITNALALIVRVPVV